MNNSQITPEEQRLLRRFIKKIDDNTWEIKEHPYFFPKIIIMNFLFCWFLAIGFSSQSSYIARDKRSPIENIQHEVWGNIENAFFNGRNLENVFRELKTNLITGLLRMAEVKKSLLTA